MKDAALQIKGEPTRLGPRVLRRFLEVVNPAAFQVGDASRVVEDGWSIKAMHRQLLLFKTWQQTSTRGEAALAGDPTNQWLTNFPRQRLSAEALRDTLMKVSGKLDLVPGGAHSFPPMAEWHVTQHHPFRGGCDHERRGVYLIN